MSSRVRRGALVAAAALLVSLVPIIGAHAATTYEVKFGAGFFGRGVPGFGNRFYPESLKIHKGDTIHVKGTIPTLLEEGVHPREFFADQAHDFGDPYFVFARDTDDGPQGVKINPTFLEDPGCGFAADDPCTHDGNSFFNPGFDGNQMWVTITANQGSVIYGYAAPFASTSFLRIEVVQDSEPASTQAELDVRAQELKDRDFEEASALHQRYSSKSTKHKSRSGQVVWDAWAGLDGDHVSLFAMYPHKLNVKKGQKVQWHFALDNEIHTATFPANKAKEIVNSSFAAWCDPDTDSGNAPDTEPEFPENGPPTCPANNELELELEGIFPHGNGVLSSATDWEDSGWRGPEMITGGFFSEEQMTIKFNAKSPSKGFRYFCTIHGGFLDGFVVVK